MPYQSRTHNPAVDFTAQGAQVKKFSNPPTACPPAPKPSFFCLSAGWNRLHTACRSGFFILLLAGLLLGACAPPDLPSPTPTPLPPTAAPPPPTATPLPSPTPGCTSLHGQVLVTEMDSTLLAKPLRLRIYLPPCYGQDSATRYPVLYLLHGQSNDDSQWDRLGAVTNADALIASGESPPFLIVMPREEYYLQDVLESQFGPALVNEVVPYMDANYATCPQRTCRAIGGLSRGAIWAVRLGFTSWGLFASIGAHSLPGVYYRLPDWLAAIPADEVPRVYMDIGTEDRYYRDAVEFEGLLTRFAVPHEWHLNPGAHTGEYWSAHVEDYLRWYTAPWLPLP